MQNQSKRARYAKATQKLGLVLTLGSTLICISLLLIYGLVRGDWISGGPYLVFGVVIGVALWILK